MMHANYVEFLSQRVKFIRIVFDEVGYSDYLII